MSTPSFSVPPRSERGEFLVMVEYEFDEAARRQRLKRKLRP